MSLTRWQPLQDIMTLRDNMDRFLSDPFFQPLWAPGTSNNTLPLDIIEHDNEVIVHATVPGYQPDQIEVSVQGDLLTVRGRMEEQNERNQDNYYLRERRMGSFQRAVRLPASVDSEKANAEYQNGVLTLHLPKTTESTPRKIKIQS